MTGSFFPATWHKFSRETSPGQGNGKRTSFKERSSFPRASCVLPLSKQENCVTRRTGRKKHLRSEIMKDRRKSVPAGPYGTLLHAPCLALRTLFPSPHHPQQHPHDSPNAGRCTTFFLLHAEAIFPAFRITPPAGGAPKSGRMLQKKYSNPGGNSAQAGNRQAVSSGRKFHPAGKPPEQDRRKNPLKKYGRREKSSHEWPVHSPFTFAAGTFQVERNMRNRCLPEKGSPRRKACCGTCRCTGGPREKISTGP